MSNANMIRAWKDEEYRLSLSEADQALLPDNPAGSFELTDTELGTVAGGNHQHCNFTAVLYCGLSIFCGGTLLLIL